MKLRRTIAVFTVVVAVSTSVDAQGPTRVAPSGRASTELSLTFVDSAARAAAKPSAIRIEYGQPHLRGRRILTDSLVPYDKPWRMGANGATTLTTDLDLVIGGKSVPKGQYVLQALPTRVGWKLLVQKEGTSPALPEMAEVHYNPADDIAQIDMRPATLATPLESLTMWLIPSRSPGTPTGQLVVAWGTVSLTTDWSLK